MKNLIYLSAVLFWGMVSCSNPNQLTFKNTLDMSRPDETIVLKRADLESKIGQIPEGQAPVLKNGGVPIPSQVDDLNHDGKWDELAATLSFEPLESVTVSVELVNKDKYPTFDKRTNVRLGILQPDSTWKEVDSYTAPDWHKGFKIIAQGESVSWENDKMGFRDYFDCRNVKDLFGKLKPGVILDKIQTPALGSYHVLADWGMDVLHCGNSLGAGGLAMLQKDSLIRLGCTDTYSYEKITTGPVRSVFKLEYTGWDVDGQNLSATEEISIYPGKHWFQSDVTVNGFTGEKQIATGIVTTKLTNQPYAFDADSSYSVIATLDKQSLNNDTLGMAVMLKKDEMTKEARTTDINYYEHGYPTVPEKEFSRIVSDTYYIGQKIQNNVPARHYFFTVWGLENSKWNNFDNFKNYIGEEAKKLNNPIVVI